ncbi:MarR family winged helix-turn-helix transcriptional regulator [Amycolatopsis sp. YIM 10]|uniref:MarR family winged helix-turn-helix transcriptional regulator n=1 Tax=Amycolatopsis sp. YIM 10 TaxID=2653857 RepID=UPI0012906236|nr:MarR family winged helix-turn-helix transcriptional regulator [Amycolatopsis sp. YIM 10]QFU91018.1 MarR family protein [Amycolatopsis sp. YIM 10]
MAEDLSFTLHRLVTRLDRSADRILRDEHGLSYRRFRALVGIDRLDPDASTQRALAADMDVSEPSASRMASVLAEAGLVEIAPDPDGGHRRRLSLTPAGRKLLEQCQNSLRQRFAGLIERSGVSHTDYARSTQLLLDTLDDGNDS